jgi:hypothetical protein
MSDDTSDHRARDAPYRRTTLNSRVGWNEILTEEQLGMQAKKRDSQQHTFWENRGVD